MIARMAALIVFACSLVGCATAISPKSLKAVYRDECIVIPQTISWKEPRGMIGYIWEEGINKGVYRAEHEDENGVFFRGGNGVVWRNVIDPSANTTNGSGVTIMDGGIWLPVNKLDKPKIYYYFGSNVKSVGDANDYALNVGNNSINQGMAAGSAMAGAAIGGTIVNAMIKADVGKMVFFPEIKDERFISNIKNVTRCPAADGVALGKEG